MYEVKQNFKQVYHESDIPRKVSSSALTLGVCSSLGNLLARGRGNKSEGEK